MKSLFIANTTGWEVGQTVAIGSSYSNQTEDEFAIITAVSNTSLTIDRPLLHEHYGDSTVTKCNSYGELDTRSVLSRLSRNIHIVGDGFGSTYRIVIDGESTAIMHAIEVSEAGSSTAAAITISNNSQLVSISNSSIHNCPGNCLNILNSANSEAIQNVFYKSQGRLVYAQDSVNLTISLNILLGALQPLTYLSSTAAVSCLTVQSHIPITSSSYVIVTNNTCQGSQGTGY